MGEFEIECKKAAGLADRISSCSRDIKRQEGRVEDVLRQIRLHEDDYYGMEQALAGITDDLHRQQEQMRQYGSMLETIVKAYENTETEIAAAGTPSNRV